MNNNFLNNLDSYIKAKQYRLVNSVLVYENGVLVFERCYNNFNEDTPNALMSVWKSILSLTLGICVDKGLVKNIDEPISNYLPQFNESTQIFHKLITIRHLLTMTSGIYFHPGVHYSVPMMEQFWRAKDWVSHISDVQVSDLPGTKFVYKEWDVILLSALIGKACGGKAWDIANEFLYKPLEIYGEEWLHSQNGINYNVGPNDACDKMTARNLAKIGQLVLNNGAWNGQQIISREYLCASFAPSAVNEKYGFLWWLSEKGFHGRGFGGQELNILPKRKIVTVLQATPTPKNKNYGDICENI
jgi:CubicO group peptidase (beta-lactamase class C family)